MRKNIIILGAGLTGLSCAYYLKRDYLIFEKENSAGGLCRSQKLDGFIFDYSGHLMHLHQSYTKKLVFRLLGDNLRKIKRNSMIYFRGKYIPYPFQANLWALPERIKNECLKGLQQLMPTSQEPGRKNDYRSNRSPFSFHNWCLNNYGKGISKYFFFPYNEKIWLHPLKEITTDWVNPFVPQVSGKEIIEGAGKKPKRDFGYNAYFYYPKKGGMQSLIDSFTEKIGNIQLNSKIEEINWKEKIISVNNEKFKYRHLVFTIPLPELLNRLENLPGNISAAKNKLSWTSVLCVNLGIRRAEKRKRKTENEKIHWLYFPENKYVFYRVGFYHNISKEMVPKENNNSAYISLYIEISHHPNEILNQKKIISQVKTDLLRCKIINRRDKLLAINLLPIPYAYVTYNHNRNSALSIVNDFLKKNSIFSIGRYGAWKYSFMEESILDGKKTAEILNQIRMTKSK